MTEVRRSLFARRGEGGTTIAAGAVPAAPGRFGGPGRGLTFREEGPPETEARPDQVVARAGSRLGQASAAPRTASKPRREERQHRQQQPAPVRPVRAADRGPPHRSTARTGGARGWVGRVFAWVLSLAALVWAGIREALASGRPAAPGSFTAMLCALERVQRAIPAPVVDATGRVIPGEVAREEEALDAIRVHRAPRTDAAVASTCRSIEELMHANRSRVERLATSADAWDRVLEAWVVTRVDPDRSPWAVPGGWRRQRYDAAATAKAAASWRAAMSRLRYAPDAWPRSKGMASALGAGDTEGGKHALPLFAWEVLVGLRTRPPASVWDRCAAALLVLTTLNAHRKSNARRITLGSVTVLSADTVSVVTSDRPKPVRDRTVIRQGKHDRPVRLQHWAVRTYVVPWLEYLRKEGVHRTALAFPSLVREGPRIARTSEGRLMDGLWCEPLRPWSDRALVAAIARYVPAPAGRTFQSLRVGNNIELRRDPGVSDVTRRTLHGRTVRDLIGSESAYNEVFAEDFARATRRLGSARMIRQPDGLVACTATSASAAEHDDWVPVEGSPAAAPPDPDTSSSESSSDDSDGRVRFECFRCGTTVERAHHGFLCDQRDCARGTCVPCHPGGEAKALWCPQHEPRLRGPK